MNDEAAFQKAMPEHPEDNSLRFVFADWLEERGDQRGELLRLLHKLTQSIEVPDRSRLEDRLRSLLLFDRQLTKAILVFLLPIGAYFATDAIKDAVARPRPLAGQPPKRLSSSGSFPSGHSSMVMTGFLLAALAMKDFWRRVGRRGVYPFAVVCAIAVAGMVGLSRLYFGYHYLSDVIGGWLLGVGFGLVFLGVEKLGNRRGKAPTGTETITSAPSPG